MKKIKAVIAENSLIIFIATALYFKGILFLFQIQPKNVNLVYFLATFFIVILVVAPALLFKKYQKVYLLIVSLFITSLYLIDLVYFRYFSAIPSMNSLFIAKQVTGVQDSVASLLRPWDLLMIIDLIIVAFLIKGRTAQKRLKKFTYLFAICVIGITLVLLSDSKIYLSKFLNNVYESKLITERYGVLGNHLIDAYRFLFMKDEKLSEEEKKEVIAWVKENRENQPSNSYTGIAKDKRVIFLQVESLQNFVIGKKIEGQEITPNLNRLMADSHYFNNNYFLIGLGNTSDSDFVVNTSLYPLADSAVTVRYPKSEFQALPKVLRENDYTTSAYHAFYRDFWNREQLFKTFGYENYYAKENYSEGKRVGMGLSDAIFLPQTVEYIKNKPEKSFNYAITLSSHFPFSLNDEDKVININREFYTPEVYRYYNSIAYADAQIGEFIKKLKENNLYEDTLLVVYGDHRANLGDITTTATQNSLMLAEKGLAQELELAKVPLFIKIPGQNGRVVEKISSSIDIMPTVLNLLGINNEGPVFGKDLFGNTKPFFASVSFYNRGLITDGEYYFLEPNNCYNKKLEAVAENNCDYLVKRRGVLQSISSKLIRYNLFPLL